MAVNPSSAFYKNLDLLDDIFEDYGLIFTTFFC
jgi:hypothetical protein